MATIEEIKTLITQKENYIDSLRERYATALQNNKAIEAMGIEEKGKAAKQDLELLERRLKALEYANGIKPPVKQTTDVFTPIKYDNQLTIIENDTGAKEIAPIFKPYKDD